MFIPHGHCYLWKPELVGLHIVSDAFIALAYYSIPLTLFYVVYRRRDLPFTWLFLLFSAFIIACGTTHVMEIWTLWHPTYWLSGAIKLVAAAFSVTTAILLVSIVPKTLALTSPAQLEVANLALAQLAAIVECSGDAIIGKSLAGIITSWNAGAVKLFGHTAEEAIGQSISMLIPPDYADELPQNLEQIKRGETIERFETVRVRKDGQRIDIAATISPVKDAAGRVIGASKIARNISERQAALRERNQIEASLRQSEARYRAIVEDQTEMIARFRPDGTLTFVNDAYCRYFDIDREELIGHRYEPVVFAEDREWVAQQVQLMTRESPTVTIENRVMVGEEARWTQWANRAFFDQQGCVSEFQAVGRDITALKQVEAALRESNHRFTTLAETAPVAIFRYDSDGNCIYVNDRWCEMTGRCLEMGMGTEWLQTIHPEDRDRTITAWARWVDSHQPGEFFQNEARILRPDGTVLWYYCQVTPETDPGGVLTGYIGTLTDINDRKRAEEQLQASLKEKDVLLKEIHHRVKNNLGVVDGLLQMQTRRSQNPEVIETLIESQNRIASIALVHEKLYRSEDLANIDFAQYISDLTAHLFDSYNIHSSQIKLKAQIDSIPLDIDIALPCGLIINELVSNALKYAFPNAQTGEIQLIFQQTQNLTLTLIVQDNGIGLPQDFDFKQTKTLGMFLVRGLVKQLRGTLEINSNLGTTARITFGRGTL